MFPGYVDGSGMTGNTSKHVFGPLALSVVVTLTTVLPIVDLVTKNHWFSYFCVPYLKTLLCHYETDTVYQKLNELAQTMLFLCHCENLL